MLLSISCGGTSGGGRRVNMVWDMWFWRTQGTGAWVGAAAVDVGVPWGQESLSGMFGWDSKPRFYVWWWLVCNQ